MAEHIETKGDLANKRFRDIRSAVKSGEALLMTSTFSQVIYQADQ